MISFVDLLNVSNDSIENKKITLEEQTCAITEDLISTRFHCYICQEGFADTDQLSKHESMEQYKEI